MGKKGKREKKEKTFIKKKEKNSRRRKKRDKMKKNLFDISCFVIPNFDISSLTVLGQCLHLSQILGPSLSCATFSDGALIVVIIIIIIIIIIFVTIASI